jgi:signal transduction histidine kinase
MTSAVGKRAVADHPFAAYAAHELRGEITLQLALAEATLADPDADAATLREMGEGIVAACERQRQLVESLLALSRSEYGCLCRERIDLAVATTEILRSHDLCGLRTTIALEPAQTAGDPYLVERLIANLVANAVRHNVPRGRIEVATYTVAGRPVFTIANTGPVIPAEAVPRLFRPFQRLGPRSAHGIGLGLAIVQAIANAHGARLVARAQTGGGLRAEVWFQSY